ncbi:MAG: recombinase family protein [Clostridiales bacterium]|nr:recombinase family protein [Clostridiales bacterium]
MKSDRSGNPHHFDVASKQQAAWQAGVCKRKPAADGPITYGYIRVSTREQNEARQVEAMKAFKVDCVLIDKQSGKNFDRPAYQKLLRKLKPGDVFVVKSIDRLGRNYSDILEQWRVITRDKGAAIVVIDMPLLDTRSNRDLTGTLIADIVLQLLSYVAETERAFIKQRQREGIAAAMARGQRFGPPPKERPAELPCYVAQWASGRISAREAARRLRLPHTTFLRWGREMMARQDGIHYDMEKHPISPKAGDC